MTTTTKRTRRPRCLDRTGLPLAAYTRVSTTGQARDGVGLDAQRTGIAAFAAANGAQVVWHEDAGISGARIANRPGLLAALESVRAGEVAGIVVAKLDRLGRSAAEVLAIAEEAQRDGWRLVALDVNLDTASPAGMLVLGVLAAAAKFEHSRISERQREKFDALRRAGRPRGHAALDPAIADQVVAERAAGSTWQAIADRLNAECVATPQGGAMWRPASVRSVVLTRQRAFSAAGEHRDAG